MSFVRGGIDGGHFRQLIILICFVVAPVCSSATTITIVNADGPGEGLNSAQAVNPVSGNSATTLGAQYINVFRAAANYWSRRVDSSVEIKIDARLDPLECDARGGVLGAAGPLTVHGNFANVPVQETWYVGPLANSIDGSDLSPGTNDVNTVFNSGLNGDPNCIAGFRWWLGIDSPAPSGTISFYDTILHEIGHGLGFLTLVDPNGERFRGFNDIYMTRLFDLNRNRFWPGLSDAQRASSARSGSQLVWRGPNVDIGTDRFTPGKTNGALRLYAPRRYSQGSSVSHWDTSLTPDELMEPFATNTSDSCGTLLAFKDMGWKTRSECGADANLAPIYSILLDD